MPRPRRMILLVAIIAAAAAVGGLAATKFIVSPAEAASKLAPPAAGPITVAVAKEALNSIVTARGDVTAADSIAVTIGAGSATGTPGIVTGRIPTVGGKVSAGQVVLEVSGRPVIALTGAVPGYRDLLPGSSGTDVLQLQKALAQLGFSSGALDGVYDKDVAAAVDKLYKSVGYSSPAANPTATAALTAAQQQQDAAQQGLAAAKQALLVASKGPTTSQRLTADGAVQAASEALNKAQNTGSAPDPAKLATATGQLQQDTAGKQQADSALAAAQGQKPPNPAAVAAAAQQVRVAQAALDTATAAVAAASQPGPPDPAAIRAAQNQLQVANAQHSELLTGPDVTGPQAAVTAAQQLLATAQQAVATAADATLTPVPLSEVLYLPTLPQRVDKVTAKIGSQLSGSVMSLSGNGLQVIATVTPTEAGLLKAGMSATLSGPTGTMSALITKIAAGAGTGESSWQVNLTPLNLTVEQQNALRGSNVKVDVKVGATAGTVLTVPIGSLFSDSAGTPRVEVLNPDGTTRFQSVRVGLSAQGKVEVHPIDSSGKDLIESPATLQTVSLVVVGR